MLQKCCYPEPEPVAGTRAGQDWTGSTTVMDIKSSVAERPLFWAAPAPEVRGPGADYGSDQIGSAPAQGKKRRLQAALAPYTNIFHFELLKSELLVQVFFLIKFTGINCS